MTEDNHLYELVREDAFKWHENYPVKFKKVQIITSSPLSQMLMQTINIVEILSTDLRFRALARDFRQFVEENYAAEEVVTIDFSGVQFASRAFMDEFYNLFLSPSAAASCPVKVEVVNLPADIAALLEAVEQTNTQPHAHSAVTEPEASVIKFKSVEEMNAFFGGKSSSCPI